jgi:small subunit ribosomal protein S6
MAKSELNVKHEVVVILDSKLTTDQKDSIVKEVTDAIVKSGGKVINSQVWLDKHRFTFQIKKCTDGTYYLINMEGETSAVEKLRAFLKLNENLLRYGIFRTEDAAAVVAASR